MEVVDYGKIGENLKRNGIREGWVVSVEVEYTVVDTGPSRSDAEGSNPDS